MEQRLSLVTLGVADLERATEFYEALGWQANRDAEGVAFFQTGGLVVALWGRSELAEDSAVVDAGGWAHYDYVRMPDYRWGIFLTPREQQAMIHVGDLTGTPAWDEVPGEHRNALRRIIVTQADTEPASVEQQRLLGAHGPEPL